MAFESNVWKQLKNLTKGEFVRALERDNFQLQRPSATSGALRTYLKVDSAGNPELDSSGEARVVIIHYHKSTDTFGPNLLKKLLEDTGWQTADLKRLKLIK
jgi:predicted RNA binding protein YcfA (HicA-like mRNA interferase family)